MALGWAASPGSDPGQQRHAGHLWGVEYPHWPVDLPAAGPQRKEDFIAFLEHLLTVYVEVPIILIVDNYSSHTAYLVRDWLAIHPQLQLYYLPKYCSDLNPVENIWLRLKNKVAANRLYGSFQLVLEAVDRFFQEMTPEQALVWAAA